MEDATKYKPEVAWRSLAHNVHLVSKATVDSPAIYRQTVKAINTQEDGANKKEVGYYFMDNFGTPYSIVAVNGDQIDVQDDFRTKRCPRSEKEGIVYQSVADGDAPYVAGIFYRHLHPLAVQNARRFELDILWRKLYDEKYLLDPFQWKKNVINTLVKFGFAIGLDNKILGEQASAAGIGGVARSFREQALGSYGKDTPALSQNAWNVLDLLLTIGNGPDVDHRSNAVEIYKSGLTKIFNSLLIGAYSHGDVLPVNGMIQYTPEKGFEKWVDTAWAPFTGSTHSPVTIASSSTSRASIDVNQVLTVHEQGGASQWVNDSNGINYQAGLVGIGTDSGLGMKLFIYDSTNQNTTVHIRNLSSSTDSMYLIKMVSGAGGGVYRFGVTNGGAIEISERSAPSTPASGIGRLYAKTDGHIYYKNDDGVEYDLTGVAGYPIEDISFEFCDVVAGTAKSYTLDIKASFGYTIESACLETDNGTLTGVAIKIGATSVTSLSNITVDTTVDETLSTGAKTVAIGNRVTLSISTGFTGTPTLIRGKLKIKRT